MRFRLWFAVVAVIGTTSFASSTAHANHAWGNYHWARTANPFTVKLGDNLTAIWDAYLGYSSTDWSVTSGSCNNSANPVRTTIVSGSVSNVKRCTALSGTVQVCNSSYGGNGWLGIASIWANGDHITQATVKLNDYYFNQAQYNTPAWRRLVAEQEVGHCFGLNHQDEDFNNADVLDACGRGTCMDYSNDPANQGTPNQHDYNQLVTIYNHNDSFTTLAAGLPFASGPGNSQGMGNSGAIDIDTENQGEWGQAIRFANGRPILFERDFGGGQKVITHVFWAE
ncbi:MAG: hypothetical protein ABIU54_00145 [Candidatus Eisenbacteria bacterium]